MENGLLEDVFPIGKLGIIHCYVSLLEGKSYYCIGYAVVKRLQALKRMAKVIFAGWRSWVHFTGFKKGNIPKNIPKRANLFKELPGFLLVLRSPVSRFKGVVGDFLNPKCTV